MAMHLEGRYIDFELMSLCVVEANEDRVLATQYRAPADID
jgi:hypothetical protein